jgi:2-oxoisovalerate dehydrogenase E2 component (dihydrolipoyl transacylase)
VAKLEHFRLPDVGEGLTEAEIVSWKVAPGDPVAVNQVVVEIETAKSLVELPSPYAGVVAALLVEAGRMVDVGTPLIAIDTSGDTSGETSGDTGGTAGAADAAGDAGAVEPGLIGGPAPGGRTSVLVGYGPRTTTAKRRPRKGAPAPPPAVAKEAVHDAFQPSPSPAPTYPGPDDAGGPPAAPAARPATAAHPTPARPTPALPAPERGATPAVPSEPAGDEHARAAPRRALAKPPVRALAKALGVDLDAVTGSGAGGVVTREDVTAAAGGAAAYVWAAHGLPGGQGLRADERAPAAARETRIPVKGVRRATAQAMVASAFTAPHVTEWVAVDVTRTMELVARLEADRDFGDAKVSPLLLVAKALLLALRRHPEVNASWDEAAQEIVVKGYVNLGIAAATTRGLLVPNIKDADRMSLRELADALAAVTATAREGRTPPADMAGGTITITNVGVFGVDAGTPILNPGEAAILCVGAVRWMPWVVESSDGGRRIEPRQVAQLALSFDHRLVDGALGSRFLADIAAVLERPETALLW